MSSKKILTSIDPIAVAARAALERNREMLDRADSIALAPKRVPEITLPDPESVREVEYDPDSVAASILLGEGTGSLPADLAIGLTGGAAGPITEAVGGKSGVLDWIPGGSLAKGAALAVATEGLSKADRLKALLANAKSLREKAGKKNASIKTANAKAYAKKKEEAALAEQEAVKKEWQDYKETVAAQEAEKAAREAAEFVNTPGGKWSTVLHQLGENDPAMASMAARHGLPARYEDILDNPTPEEKRALYVLDSLASVAAKGIGPKRTDMPGRNTTIKDFQHQYTTYNEAMKRFFTDMEENLKTGNLKPSGRVGTVGDYKATLGGDIQRPVLDGSTEKEADLYGKLFKPRSWVKMDELKPKGWIPANRRGR